ncbi:MAG: hypothetical protein IMY72_05475 [Bacteroidetes bacterium]|nr:hypothetical protein [Bacteroidota bacterium]
MKILTLISALLLFVYSLSGNDTILIVDIPVINKIDSLDIQISNNIPEASNNKGEKRESHIKISDGIVGSIFGAILSGLIALFIFYLGRRNEKLKRNRQMKAFGKELLSLTNNICNNSNKQIVEYKKTITSISKNKYKQPYLKKITLSVLERAKAIESSVIFNTFNHLKIKDKSYLSFYLSIDFIFEVFNNSFSDYENLTSNIISPFSKEFISLKNRILDLLEISFEAQAKKVSNDCSKFVEKILNDYDFGSQSENSSIEYDLDNLLLPLNKKFSGVFKAYKIALSTKPILKKAIDLSVTISQQNQKFSFDIEEQLENLEKFISDLNDIKTQLQVNYAS